MARRERKAPDPSRSPLAELDAELRSLDRRRLEAIRAADRMPSGRLEFPTHVAPGSWSDLERTVYAERAA